MNISLKHNPFTTTTELFCDGEKVVLDKIGDGKHTRLHDWLYDFFPDIKNHFNLGEGIEINVSFTGTSDDYADLLEASDAFCKDNSGITISLEHKKEGGNLMSLSERMTALRDLFDEVQEGPYEELKNDKHRNTFEHAVNGEYEINVIAPVSAGKSTLINAIIGQDLLPALNQPTTAIKAVIKDNDNAKEWTVRGLRRGDGEFEEVYSKQPATSSLIKELNDKDNIETLEIDGNIESIQSQNIRLLLSDSPGTNNAMNDEHSRHLRELIKDETYKPMILYVLNARNTEVNDDKNLIEQISEAMKNSKKQNKDRFLFALNQLDELDPDKEVPKVTIERIKENYLEKKLGITNPRIFPVSAKLAKLTKLKQKKIQMSEDDEDWINGKKPDKFISDPKRHFSDFASLSSSCKRKQAEMLKEAEKNGDTDTQKLIYSGVCAVELAINEYI
jgi:GTPase Era involved in 16S rRNA processing